MESLPNEIMIKISLSLNIESLLSLMESSKLLYHILNDNYVWKSIYQRDYNIYFDNVSWYDKYKRVSLNTRKLRITLSGFDERICLYKIVESEYIPFGWIIKLSIIIL